MPAPISFGARTGRDNNYVGVTKEEKNPVGPGTYGNLGAAISPTKPSYAPFGSTAKRKFNNPNAHAAPSPMTYDPKPVGEEPTTVSAPFKGNAPRIPEPRKQDYVPGPGAYQIPSTIKPSAPSLQRSFFDESPLWSRTATAPSIPGRGQCYGYEEGDNGELVMQRPVHQGYKGVSGDTVGPMDYKPKLSQTHKTTNVINFGKGTSRPDISNKLTSMKGGNKGLGAGPGPGSYNLEGKTNTSAAKPAVGRKRNAVFESKVQRLKEKRSNEVLGPSPTSYNIPSTLKIQEKPDNVQCFGTSSDRFQTSKSIGPSPGTYSKPVSDFERRAMEARKVRMRQPGHKEPTPFGTSGQRFRAERNDVGAAPGSYEFNDSMAKELQKKLVSRNGAFGSSSKRFPKWESDKAGSKSAPSSRGNLKLATGEYQPPAKPKNSKPYTGRPERNFLKAGGAGKGKTSSFASSSKRGYAKSSADVAPPPGTYDVSLKWAAKSVVPLHSGPASRIPTEKSTTADVGPAQYNIKSQFAVKRNNRKDIMVSTQSRWKGGGDQTPGPSDYYSEYASGGMVRPTFNIAIAESSRVMF
ncbi:hypothetical protein TL16_g03520 [Triparma laevis f. inornata]|uniref:Uncharacterized protein n=1 Tax=Triparma laevis f. inornata TaxID=1714386 RepID=A0A9W7A4Q5_9STRA|nr:hypothetical protein TL16_g03520 [Triparma laevis f. inornata]